MKLNHHAMITTQILVILLTTAALAVPGDENWDTTWGLPGTDGEVHGIQEFNGDLVIVGRFTQVGDVTAYGVAIYDGATWSPMGGGLIGEPYSVAIYNNELYVGGNFTLADGTPAGGLVKWSGSTWIANVGGGTNGDVEDMAVYAGELVICGSFYEVGGGTPAGSVAGWNGTSWSNFAGGTESGTIYRMAADAINLYVTGYFEDIGGDFVNNVARWNGSAWSNMGSGLTDEFGEPYDAEGADIHVWDGKVVVTGYFTYAGGQNLVNFAVWNGSSWGGLGGNPEFFLDGAFTIGDYDGELLVYGGFSNIWNWNGIFWNSNINGGYFSSMGQYGDALVLGGLFQHLNGVPAKNLGLFDGTNSSALATGNGIDGRVDVVHEWDGQLVAGGGPSTRFGGITDQMIAIWDGSQWNSLGGGLGSSPGTYLVDLETFQGDLVVSGIFDTAGGAPASRFARWDGASWSQLGDGSGFGAGDMEIVDGELFANVSNPGSVISRLNSVTNTWEYIGDTPPGTTFSSLGQYNGQLIVAGGFPEIEGVSAQGIATWNGSTWAPLGAGIDGGVNGMAEYDGKLYVAGVFGLPSGAPERNAAVWDGVSWSPVGGGLGNRAFDLEEFNGDIFVTGEMPTAGGVPASNVARWDGANWHGMGSGLNDRGFGLAVVNGKLFVGGEFTVAGGNFSAGIGGWSMGGVAAVGPFAPGTLALAPGAPNPFTHGTTFFFELGTPGNVKVDIFDMRGRRVSQRLLMGLSIGQHSFSWDGRDARGRRAANGTYFVQVKTARQQAMRRVTIVR